jgi:predicted RNA-binding Zn-ribbon protein involved in translation (DUF1610 family)
LIEYKCSGCGLVLYRVVAARRSRSQPWKFRLVEEWYSKHGYAKRRCNAPLEPAVIARIYKNCPKCGKPLAPSGIETHSAVPQL